MLTDIENQRITTVPALDGDVPPSDPGLVLATRRTVSIQASATGHPSARLPVEFRTMSLQLETTGKAQPANNGKNAVKGAYCPSLLHLRRVVFSPLLQICLTSTGTTCLSMRRFAD